VFSNVEFESSPMQPGDILFTEKLLFLYIIELQNIYVL
jgi:hypothetical protein